MGDLCPVRAMRWALTGLFVTAALLAGHVSRADSAPLVVVLDVKGAIGPAVSDYLGRGIEKAEELGAEAVVIRLDTPGGLDSSMREINKRIIAARIPVISFVSPSGARAASAGTYILYASHVAAMAPATNLGAATPVQMSPGGLPDKPGGPGTAPDDEEASEEEKAGDLSPSERKLVNDAAAYIRALAKMRGRNAQWAEEAVREGASLTAEEALEQGVVDLVAADLDALLAALDGREVEVGQQMRRLDTANVRLSVLSPDWRSRLLAVITNPNVAYILMLLGIYGLFFELANPGNILPGVAGAVSLLLALYALQVLPVNYAGVALMLLGMSFMIAEAFVPSFGALGIGGVIAFVVGSLILMDTDVEGYTLSVPLIVGFGLASAAFFTLVVSMVSRLRGRPVVSGQEEMIGSVGEAMEAFDGRGRVSIHGESWQARSRSPVAKGQRVRVSAVKGLTLMVEPESEEN